MKKIALFVVFLGFFTGFLSAQTRQQDYSQIPKFAVVDVQKVHEAYFRNSAPMRQFEANRTAVQEEINELAVKIRELRETRAEAAAQEDFDEVWQLDFEIANLTENLRSFRAQKDAELEAQYNALFEPFTRLVNNIIKSIAENEGISIVFGATNVLFYHIENPAVDFTGRVIDRIVQSPR
ncbi:MAG: OmpH family outer membrane protein [Treponema sp.]|nr:OmpH family outer membrane protein [Treponema sp.]